MEEKMHISSFCSSEPRHISRDNIKDIPERNSFTEKIPDLRTPPVKLYLIGRGYHDILIITLLSILVFFLLSFTIYELRSVSLAETEILISGFEVLMERSYYISLMALLLVFFIYYSTRKMPIYIRDFATYNDDSSWESFSVSDLLKNIKKDDGSPCFDEEQIAFQERIMAKSCVGSSAYFPPFFRGLDAELKKSKLNLKNTHVEAETVMFKCVEALLKNTRIGPKDIDILVVNCSLFCPTPSLSSMIVNKFKMKSTILSYNLGGMGCSAGVIAIDLASQLLQLHKNSLAIVVSTESITQNIYTGKEKQFLLANTLFRLGCSAVMLSNRSSDYTNSLFVLHSTVRTHKGADDSCFDCVVQDEDKEGIVGVRIAKNIMSVAGDALKTNLTTVGPRILPFTEHMKFFLNLFARTILKKKFPKFVPISLQNFIFKTAVFFLYLPKPEENSFYCKWTRFNRRICHLDLTKEELKLKELRKARIPESKTANEESITESPIVGTPYIPDFTTAIQHFCIHAGGRAVIDAIERNLNLPEHYLDASRYTLWRYGNTSSSSIWYEMDYHLKYSDVRKGDKVLQIAFGSGFKCNSIVWTSLNNL